MDVISTRNAGERLPATQAVLKGIAEDGGLFVPTYFPEIDLHEAQSAAEQGYAALAAFVMAKFFEIPAAELKELAKQAYQGYDDPEIVPFRQLGAREYVMELFHGPTLAFKDMALQVLPRLIAAGLKLHNQEKDIMVLTATSGDTGKAALEGFRDVARTAIMVFYPQDGVAPMQKLQMVTQEGTNTGVCAVKGNFDDAQTGVKRLFADAAFNREMGEKGYTLSSANSINIGRLVPQVAYYVYAYERLVADGKIMNGDPVNFCVPTGNFGNILAAYYAMKMGVPVRRLICASNKNNVLTDFFRKGSYNAKREFHKTMSPSMDILISSNLERLLFELADRDGCTVCDWMRDLAEKGEYDIPKPAKERLEKRFYADFCDEEETAATIRRTFEAYGYLMDTHTAVAQCVYEKYVKETGDGTFTVVASTANPYKFTQDVLLAVTGEQEDSAFLAADKLSRATGTRIPAQIAALREKRVLHEGVVEKDGLAAAVNIFLEKE